MTLIPQPTIDEEFAEKRRLMQEYMRIRSMRNSILKDAILDGRRIDLLAIHLMGIYLKWYHLKMLAWQESHPNNLILCWRGAGKTTAGTVLRAIAEILWNPNIRILIASKSHVNAQGMLSEIQGYFKSEKMVEIFGDLAYKTDKWDTYAMNIGNKTTITKEHTIDTTGIETALPSRHYDLIFGDDLCDESTARTKAQREKQHTWFYKTLDPCLMEDGRKMLSGTRYHHEDIYATVEKGEMKGNTLIIPIENEKGEPADPDRFPKKWIESKRTNAGRIIFDTQYMLNCEKISQSPFEWEGISNYYTFINNKDGERTIVRDGKEVKYKDLLIYQGVDPATGTVGAGGSYFAHVTIGLDRDNFIYILNYYFKRISFYQQLQLIRDYHGSFNPIAIGIEANAYQRVLVDALKFNPNNQGDQKRLPVIPIITRAGKDARVLKRTATFDQGRVWMQRSHTKLQDHLMMVLDPDEQKDLFDALDMSITLADSSVKKLRPKEQRAEPGILGKAYRR